MWQDRLDQEDLVVMRWMRQNEDGFDLVHNNDDNENVKEEEVLNLMIIKIVIILMEVMWAKEDVLHLGHSGSAGRPRGTVCLHTTTGETGGGLRPARGNTHYLQEHTHNSNTRARVSQTLLIWFKHNYIHGALLFHFNPSSTCLHFLNFSNTFSPSSQSLTPTY